MNRIPSREQVENLRQRYPIGTRIVLHRMDDSYSINREVQRGFREMEQAIQPDEFSVDKGKASKAAKTEKQPESR